ncbi:MULTISPECIES: hypothetical protein [Niastella]|uniref:Uncharacterized protein n=1 Tax=Niastella soli TaxID=2821487 RepID=A0ABS3YWU5_9BACT|nr:hypothetical protein [Niastella soli]MBO9202395.1 hypothetical protein [Niastella soli]
MENNKMMALKQRIERMEGALLDFFTPDKLKNDLFKENESEICVVHNFNDGAYDMELSRQDEFKVLSIRTTYEFRGLSFIVIDIAVGGMEERSYPIAGKCYMKMEYNQDLEYHDVIIRDFY